MNIAFCDAVENQAHLLSDLAIKSKGHWGYSRSQLDRWREELKIEKSYIRENIVQIVLLDDDPVGFFALTREDGDYVLDHLWLIPEVIGRGIGKCSFERVEKVCMAAEVAEFTHCVRPQCRRILFGPRCREG